VREASSAENSTSSQNVRASFTPSTACFRASSGVIFSFHLRWMPEVARNV